METPPLGKSPLHRFPEYTQALGMITVEMGALEASCVHLLAAILRVSESAADAILMTPQSTRVRLDILKSIAEQMLPDFTSSKIIKLIAKCDKALNKRNTYIHGVWGADDEGVLLIPIPKGATKRVHLSELEQQIASLRQLADSVSDATQAVRILRISESFRHYSVNVTYNIGELK